MNKRLTDVLVLNKSWVPTSIVTWKKAMTLIYQDAARSLDRDFVSYEFKQWLEFSNTPTNNDYPTVSTVKNRIAIPEIIVLTRYNKLPIRDVKYSRETLFASYGFKCAYCGNVFDKKELTVDHVLPRSKGGKTSFENTVPACKACNFEKADKTLAESGLKLRYKLKKPKWIGPLSHVRHGNIRKSWKKFIDRPLIDDGDGDE